MLFADLGITNIYAYMLGAFLIILCPGPNSLYVLNTSIRYGMTPAFRAMAAVICGDTILITASFLGVASLIKANPELFFILKALGAAYLCYLGIKIILETLKSKKTANKANPQKKLEDKQKVKAFRTAMLLSLTNPKAILFFMAFFVQFIDNSYGHTGLCYLILASILQFFSFSYLLCLILGGRAIVKWIQTKPFIGKLGNRLAGSVFILFAAKLVMDA